MTKEKLEQLRKAFKRILEINTNLESWNIDRVVNKMLYEIKIRVNNKENSN